MPRPIPRTWGGHGPDLQHFTPARAPGGCGAHAGGGVSAERLQDFKLHVVSVQRSLITLLQLYRAHVPSRQEPRACGSDTSQEPNTS
jgi:hypothetical protein